MFLRYFFSAGSTGSSLTTSSRHRTGLFSPHLHPHTPTYNPHIHTHRHTLTQTYMYFRTSFKTQNKHGSTYNTHYTYTCTCTIASICASSHHHREPQEGTHDSLLKFIGLNAQICVATLLGNLACGTTVSVHSGSLYFSPVSCKGVMRCVCGGGGGVDYTCML